MRKNKKGDAPSPTTTGATAATLIGIITILFIFYILFLPPAERTALLGDDIEPGEPGAVGPAEILLQAPIGRLETVPQREMEHYVPNIYLQEYTQAQVLAEINPFTIRKTLTKSDTKNFTFGISDPENTESVMLSLAASTRKGTLKIKLNGYEIFEGELTQQNPPPIPLRKSYLRNFNTLEFEVKGFGMPAKEYSFIEVKIVGDVIDARRLVSTNTIPISDVEYNNLERAWLDYYPTCDQLVTGALEVSLNGKIVSSGVPSCESPSRQDLFQEDIKPGKNTLVFKSSKGNIGIEQIKLKTILKPTKGFSDFFTISPELYEDIVAGRRRVVINVEFIDDAKIKRAQININGRLDIIDQRSPKFTRVISNVVDRGNNYLEVMPLTELNIVRVEIRAE